MAVPDLKQHYQGIGILANLIKFEIRLHGSTIPQNRSTLGKGLGDLDAQVL